MIKIIIFFIFTYLSCCNAYNIYNIKNLENKYEYTYDINCKSELNFEYRFYNYQVSNVTNFNYSQNIKNVVFLADNMFKKSNKTIELVIQKNLYHKKQVISFVFSGFSYETKHILQVNIILDKCSNFRDIVQVSYDFDKNTKIYTDTLQPIKDGQYTIDFPAFNRSSDMLFKFYFIDEREFALLNFVIPICFQVLIMLYIVTK